MSSPIGLFETSSDIGAVRLAGSSRFNQARSSYSIEGAGENIWGSRDEFHFLWRRHAGDVALECSLDWITPPRGNRHRKGGVMLRAGLEPDAPFACIAVHGSGLVALQFRRERGGPTASIPTSIPAPVTVRIERHGDVVSADVARRGGPFHPLAALTVPLPQSVHAGLFLCSHDAGRIEAADFTGVSLRSVGVVEAAARTVESTLETVDTETGERSVVFRSRSHFEAPNWSRDGKALYYNGGGNIYRLPLDGGEPVRIDTGGIQCNNDHGLSPDGKTLVISGRPGSAGQSQIFLLPAAGGTPRLITPLAPSYWHGWSPDGTTLAYCASRSGEYDIYTIQVEGGEERRLTNSPGLDDGPDYSADGRFLYFNSERSGLMRIWRMKADGSDQEMVSQGPESADWFPHPSPDGRWIVYLSYDRSVKGHPANKDVTLKIMPAPGGPARVLATLYGGQGTINVPSWSPDSRKCAFVSYRLVAPRKEEQ